MKTRALSLLLTIAIFTSLTFEAFHTGHEAACHEENCPVCLVLQLVRNTIKLAGKAKVTQVKLPLFYEEFIISLFTIYFISITLVNQKRKLTI